MCIVRPPFYFFSKLTSSACASESFHETQTSFRAALCDSFNTPLAFEILLKLVSRTNIYINTQGHIPDAEVVECIAHCVVRMLRVFGLGEGDAASWEVEIWWGKEQASSSINVSLRP